MKCKIIDKTFIISEVQRQFTAANFSENSKSKLGFAL